MYDGFEFRCPLHNSRIHSLHACAIQTWRISYYTINETRSFNRPLNVVVPNVVEGSYVKSEGQGITHEVGSECVL